MLGPAEPGRLELELPDGNGGKDEPVGPTEPKVVPDPEGSVVTETEDEDVTVANEDVEGNPPDVEVPVTFEKEDERPDVVAGRDVPGPKGANGSEAVELPLKGKELLV